VIHQHDLGDPRCCLRVVAVVSAGDCFRLDGGFQPASASATFRSSAMDLTNTHPTIEFVREKRCLAPEVFDRRS
jgi:hypothetical protein